MQMNTVLETNGLKQMSSNLAQLFEYAEPMLWQEERNGDSKPD
jgi:hypothetical protein